MDRIEGRHIRKSILEKTNAPKAAQRAAEIIKETEDDFSRIESLYRRYAGHKVDHFYDTEMSLYQTAVTTLKEKVDAEHEINRKELRLFMDEFQASVPDVNFDQPEIRQGYLDYVSTEEGYKDFFRYHLYEGSTLWSLSNARDILACACKNAIDDGEFQFLTDPVLLQFPETARSVERAVVLACRAKDINYLRNLAIGLDMVGMEGMKLSFLDKPEVLHVVNEVAQNHPNDFMIYGIDENGWEFFNFLPDNAQRAQDAYENLKPYHKLISLEHMPFDDSKKHDECIRALDGFLEYDPEKIFLAFPDFQYKGFITQLEWTEYLVQAAELNPVAGFRYYSSHRNEDIFQETAKIVLKENVLVGINEVLGEPEQPYPPEFLTVLRELAIGQYPDFIIYLYENAQTDEMNEHRKKGVFALIDEPTYHAAKEQLGTGINRWKISDSILRIDNLDFQMLHKECLVSPDMLKGRWIEDPSLGILNQIQVDWIEGTTDFEREQLAVDVARFLYPDQKVNRESVLRAQKVLKESYNRYVDVELFDGRNIILGSHNEVSESGKDKFGKDEWKSYLTQDSGAERIDHFEAVLDSQEDLAFTRQEILDQISSPSPEPVTFIWDGHGGPDAIYLSDGTINLAGVPSEKLTTIKITYQDLGDAFIERAKKHDISKDIIMIPACFSYNFCSNLSQYFLEKGIEVPPILISTSEYNQYSYSDSNKIEGNEIFSFYAKNKSNTVGELVSHSFKIHNINVFVPGIDSESPPIIRL